MLYYYDDYSGEIRFIDKVDKSTKKETDGFRWFWSLVLKWFYSLLTVFCCCSAMRKFRDLDKRAIVESTVSNTALDTIHQNTISEIRLFDQKQIKADKITSVGVDGQMVIWDLKVTWSTCKSLVYKLTYFFSCRHLNHLSQIYRLSRREPRIKRKFCVFHVQIAPNHVIVFLNSVFLFFFTIVNAIVIRCTNHLWNCFQSHLLAHSFASQLCYFLCPSVY